MGFIFSAIVPGSATAGVAPGSPGKCAAQLRIAGSTTMAPLLTEIAARYRLLRPEVSIDVEATGSARGLDDVRSGNADIAMLSRALAPAEDDLYGIPIARAGIGVVVHANNPLRQLSLEQLREAPGAEDAPSSDPERLAMVAGSESAIAYVSLGAAERAIAQGVPVRLLAIAGVPASGANARNGSYPICHTLTLVSRDAPVGVARSFFAFCLSAQVNGILSAFDFVPYLD